MADAAQKSPSPATESTPPDRARDESVRRPEVSPDRRPVQVNETERRRARAQWLRDRNRARRVGRS